MSLKKTHVFPPTILTVHEEHVLGAYMWTSLIGSDTLICPVIVRCHWSEVQCVVFSVVGHVCVSCGGVHADVEVYVVLHPVDLVIGPSNFTGESEVFRAYWNCVVSDHH